VREILDPLAHIPGVRLVALMSPDGVPIATACADRAADGPLPANLDQDEELNSVTALAAGWLSEVSRAALQLSWDAPLRAVLRASQGTLVLHQAPGAIVVAVLERGVPYEELRIPIEGALARMQRMLRTLAAPHPTAPLPSEPTQVASATVAHQPQVENRPQG
jgi:predicted regulator of Ras-like GTPase activity (Roadblock/LC7/MglB family)